MNVKRPRNKSKPKTYTNVVNLKGTLETKFEVTYSNSKVTVYESKIRICRRSGESDIINLQVSSKALENINADVNSFNVGDWVYINGSLCSYDTIDGNGKNIVLVFVRIRNILAVTNVSEQKYLNSINLKGYLCKPPEYRKTPLGKEITDLIIAVNRKTNKADYLPVICWNSVARMVCKKYKIGSGISIHGRIQSRAYTKIINDEKTDMTVIEVSCTKVFDNR